MLRHSAARGALLHFDAECVVFVSVFEDDDAAVFDDFADALSLVYGDVLDAGRPVDFDFGCTAPGIGGVDVEFDVACVIKGNLDCSGGAEEQGHVELVVIGQCAVEGGIYCRAVDVTGLNGSGLECRVDFVCSYAVGVGVGLDDYREVFLGAVDGINNQIAIFGGYGSFVGGEGYVDILVGHIVLVAGREVVLAYQFVGLAIATYKCTGDCQDATFDVFTVKVVPSLKVRTTLLPLV